MYMLVGHCKTQCLMAMWWAAGRQVLDARLGDAGGVAGCAGSAQGAEVRAARFPAGHPHRARGPRQARLRQGGPLAAQPFIDAHHAAGLPGSRSSPELLGWPGAGGGRCLRQKLHCHFHCRSTSELSVQFRGLRVAHTCCMPAREGTSKGSLVGIDLRILAFVFSRLLTSLVEEFAACDITSWPMVKCPFSNGRKLPFGKAQFGMLLRESA